MIKIRRIFGLTVVTGTPYEMRRVDALSGIEPHEGDRVTLLPPQHHIHRNPRRKALIKYIEDQGGVQRGFEIKTDGDGDGGMRMRKIILATMLTILMFGCSNDIDSKVRKQARANAIKRCVDTGGMPIFSVWDGAYMTDCKYPPTAATK